MSVMGILGRFRPWNLWRGGLALRKHLPELRFRVVNVVNLMKPQPRVKHPHGLSDRDFDVLFTRTPIVFVCLPRISWLSTG